MSFVLIILATSTLSALGVLTFFFTRTQATHLIFGFLVLLALLPLGIFLPGIDFSFTETPTNGTSVPWINILLNLWALGVLISGIKLTQDLRAYQAWTHNAIFIEDEHTLALLKEVSKKAGLRHAPDLAVTPEVSSPVLGGILNPTLYLPEDYQKWSLNTVEMVFWHEIGHMAKHDLIKQFVGRLIKTTYWFNPFINSLLRTLSRQCELSCDSWVIQKGVTRKTYLHALCDVAESTPPNASPALGLSMADHATLSERVKLLIQPPSQKRPIIVGLTLTLLSVFGLAIVSLKPNQTTISQQEIELRLTANPFPLD